MSKCSILSCANKGDVIDCPRVPPQRTYPTSLNRGAFRRFAVDCGGGSRGSGAQIPYKRTLARSGTGQRSRPIPATCPLAKELRLKKRYWP
jgi:hypothetical protein